MKKLTTALLAAGLIISASACSAPAQLTTEQTCDRIKIVVTNPSASAGKTGMNILANKLRPIIGGASDELKPSVKAIVAWADESAKESPDDEKLKALTADYQKAGSYVRPALQLSAVRDPGGSTAAGIPRSMCWPGRWPDRPDGPCRRLANRNGTAINSITPLIVSEAGVAVYIGGPAEQRLDHHTAA